VITPLWRQHENPGLHAVHIHAVGKCEGPGFTSAAGHFNLSDPAGNAGNRIVCGVIAASR